MSIACLSIVLFASTGLVDDPAVSLEREVVAARSAITSGHVRLSAVRRARGVETPSAYEVWFDPDRLRVDSKIWKPGTDPKTRPAHVQQTNLRTPEHVVSGNGAPPANRPGPLAAIVRGNDSATQSIYEESFRSPAFFDPRLLGMSVGPVDRLHGKSLEILVGRADQRNPRSETTNGVTRIDYQRPSGSRVTLWIDPEKGPSLERAEIGGERAGDIVTDVIECDLQLFGDTWFPRTVRYTRSVGDEVVLEEVVTTEAATFNERPDERVFSIEGLDLPAGTPLDELPAHAGGTRVWNGSEIVGLNAAPAIVVPQPSGRIWWALGSLCVVIAIACLVAYRRIDRRPDGGVTGA